MSYSCSCSISGQTFFDVVEHALPSTLMTVARGLVEQLFVVERKQRALPLGFEQHRNQRLALGRRMPGPAKHQPLIRHHLAIDAVDLEVLAVIPVEAEAIAATNPRIDAGALAAGLYPRGSKPTHYFFRIGPRRVDFFRRRVEMAFEGEAWSGAEAGVAGNAWFGSHLSSSTKAARRSRFSDQKR